MSRLRVHTDVMSTNLKNDKKLVIISDIHDDGLSKRKEKYQELIQTTERLEPNYIVIPGDIIQSHHASITNIDSLIQEFGMIAPTVLSLGNHERGACDHGLSLNWYHELERFSHVYPLDNSDVSFGSIHFTGFNPTLEVYLAKKQQKNNLFIEEFQKAKLTSNRETSMNIMLCHSPEFICKDTLIRDSSLANYDLFISGHNHNGCTPTFMEKIMGTRGLVGPCFTLFPKNCRGLIDVHNSSLFVSMGFRKFTQENAVMDKVDDFFPNDIHQLVLTRK